MEKTASSWRSFISNIRHQWENLFLTPLSWLFLCFFQPTRFSERLEYRTASRRLSLMLRLRIPLFLLIFLVALPVQGLLPCVHFCTVLSLFTWNTLRSIISATLLGVSCGLFVGMIDSIGLGIIVSISFGVTGIIFGDAGMGEARGLALAVASGLVAGTAKGLKWGVFRGVLAGILCGLSWVITSASITSVATSITLGMSITFVFFVCYMLGYYRIPLYMVSSSSELWAYIASKRNPATVFFNLHRSALYWDECVFLPLPLLRRTLLIAVGQNIQQALDEISFIVEQRPQQIHTAYAAAVEIALRDLHRRETIRDIAKASPRLNEILPLEMSLYEPNSLTPFTHLIAVSIEAQRYSGPLRWQTRLEALEKMRLTLEQIYPDTAFPDTRLNTLLAGIINKWHAVIRYQQEKLEQEGGSVGLVMNPYNPGNPLKPHDPLFVGRRDVVRQLSESLSNRNRPTFLLNGERRMGKSSTLRQLPHLLGASYICVLYDLQSRSMSSSIEAFLTKLAEDIYKAVCLRGMNIERLEYNRLHEALQRNEAATYQPFDEWLDKVEGALQRENHTLLLLFDEFEKLEEARKAGYLDLNLLLDWFRNTIQNRPYVVLLFSGVNTFGEMGENWAGYFVNAKTFKVGFLTSTEAHDLITKPLPNFPTEQLFAQGVVEEIIYETGCHPFLLQAICSELVDDLNHENRQRVEMRDVAKAVTNVLDNWWDTYFRDLWARTDHQQRTCLLLLSQQEASNETELARRSGLDEQTIRQTLHNLVKRDLVQLEQQNYNIAAPILHQWIARNR